MRSSSRGLAAFLAIGSCLGGPLSYHLHAHHVGAAHAQSHEFHSTDPSAHHHHDEAEHDSSDHSHELVAPPDAVTASAVHAPTLVLLGTQCEYTALWSDLVRLLLSQAEPRAGPPRLFLQSRLNL